MVGSRYKQLHNENWLLPDPESLAYSSIELDGVVFEKKPEEWIRQIFSPQLSDNVPLEVKNLFEVARGALVYGFLYFPLYTLAAEQLFRVAETAITLKCVLLNCPQKRTFEKKLNWLKERGVLSTIEEKSWQKVRKYRNASSHPDDQEMFPPGWAIDFLFYITENINKLFSIEQQ